MPRSSQVNIPKAFLYQVAFIACSSVFLFLRATQWYGQVPIRLQSAWALKLQIQECANQTGQVAISAEF